MKQFISLWSGLFLCTALLGTGCSFSFSGGTTHVLKGKDKIAVAAQQPEAPKPKPKVEPVRDNIDVIDEISKQNLDPDVRASILEAELGKTDIQLEEMEKAKQTGDEVKKQAQAEVEQQLLNEGDEA